MVITDIKQQLRLTDRYSIFIDGRYSLSLSSQKLLELKLFKGQRIDKVQFKELKQVAISDKLYGLVLRYCTSRLRSQKEVELYLERKQIDSKTQTEIIDRLKKLDFINDVSFAKSWINSRQQRAFSQRRIIQELRQKGVTNEIIASALSIEDADDSRAIVEVVRKKRQQAKYANDDLRLMRYLAQKGFNYANIKRAVKGDKNSD
ncbi:MAG: RecX family transcriptional regulator [Candidatus Saccharimonadales bacterium]|jgi:regulatory protein